MSLVTDNRNNVSRIDQGARGVLLEGVSKELGGAPVIQDLNLHAKPGEFLSLLGPSGAGKSTILNLIAGFLAPDRGRILLDGKDATFVPAHRRNLGFIFQDYALFPHMSVGQNVRFPLDMRRVKKGEANKAVHKALAMVGLESFADRSPRTLSGGQRQRVAIARSLVFEPSVLLMDEPLSSLDRTLREEMTSEIRRLQEATGVTVIYVTHDQAEALGLSHRVGILGQGRILQVDTPQVIHERPVSSYVARLVGSINIERVSLTKANSDGGAFARIGSHEIQSRPAPQVTVMTDATIGVRPYVISISAAARDSSPRSERNRITGHLVSSSLTGSGTTFVVNVGTGKPWEVTVGHLAPSLVPGDEVDLTWDVSSTILMEN